jgi:hypothetical protein
MSASSVIAQSSKKDFKLWGYHLILPQTRQARLVKSTGGS